MRGFTCSVGLRTVTYHVLCGALLSLWTALEDLLCNTPDQLPVARAMQVVRCRTASGARMVGEWPLEVLRELKVNEFLVHSQEVC